VASESYHFHSPKFLNLNK